MCTLLASRSVTKWIQEKVGSFNQPALRMGVRQANTQKARVSPAKLREGADHDVEFKPIKKENDSVPAVTRNVHLCSTHSNNLSLGNAWSDAPHEQRAGPMERPRPGRVIFGLLFFFLVLFSILLWFLLFIIGTERAKWWEQSES